ncbi:hypothetical protein, partial [Shewanella algae]|uniref:hypothetical protein n=1 Tax=Shewanella algae TaxID=38313 RepID=UPI001F2B5B25
AFTATGSLRYPTSTGPGMPSVRCLERQLLCKPLSTKEKATRTYSHLPYAQGLDSLGEYERIWRPIGQEKHYPGRRSFLADQTSYIEWYG